MTRKTGLSDDDVASYFNAMAGGSGSAQSAAPAPAQEAAQTNPTTESAAAAAAPEKTLFKLKITEIADFATNKLKVIKVIRGLKPGESLEQSKAYVTTLPSVLFAEINKADAEKAQKELATVGAKTELV